MKSVEERFNRTDYCGNLRLKDVGRKVSKQRNALENIGKNF